MACYSLAATQARARLSPHPALPAAAAAPSPLQLLPAVSRKPPQLKLHGHQRFWGWLQPVFRVTDEELVRTAGLDALIAVSEWRERGSEGLRLEVAAVVAAMPGCEQQSRVCMACSARLDSLVAASGAALCGVVVQRMFAAR